LVEKDAGMTEQEWLECADPQPMLDFLIGKAGDRKMRLFACACCRRIWRLLVDVRSQRAVEVAERFIESEVSRVVLASAITAADEAIRQISIASGPEAEREAAVAATKAAICARITAMRYNHDAWVYAAEDTSWHVRYADENEDGEQASLLRDLFGPLPFGPISRNPLWFAWNNRTVPKIAQTIYDDRAFDRMPILADALEEAGCGHTDILNHCRSDGPHVRGCWVVDLVLGKT
jgi:hypothetical protein